MSVKAVTRSLGFAGLLPFYGFVAGAFWFEDYPQALSVQGFVLYSLAILCFLSGALWGQARASEPAGQIWRLVVSNGVVIFAVASLLTAQVFLASVLLMLGYLALLWYERSVDEQRGWYAVMRLQLTLGVVFAHLLFAVLQITRH